MVFLKILVKVVSVILIAIASGNLNAQDYDIAILKKKLDTVKYEWSYGINNNLAYVYTTMNRYDSALYFYERAREVAEYLHDELSLSQSLNGMAVMYVNYGDYNKALPLFLESLRLSEKYGRTEGIYEALTNIAAVYHRQRNFAKALQYLQQSRKMHEEEKDTAGLQLVYSNIGATYDDLKNYDSALFYYKKSDQYYTVIKHIDDPGIKAMMRINSINMAYTYNNLKKYQLALDKMLPLREEIKHLNNIDLDAGALLGIAEAYGGLNRLDSANAYLKEAERLLKGNDIPHLNFIFLRVKADIMSQMGNYRDAYETHVLYKLLGDSITSKENTAIQADIYAKYETEKKDLQIAQLNNQKKMQRTITGLSIGAAAIALGLFLFALRSRRLQRKLFNQKEELLNKEKEIEHKGMEKKMNELEQMALRAQMNPHFIFNSLNSVQHFVLKQDVEGVNKYLGAFAHLIRQTLNNSGKPFITIDEELKYLDTYLLLEKMKSDNKFTYTITVSEEIDRSATFIPGMILQPFVENSIKHGVAYKEDNDGYIHITLSKNDKLVCTIEDNGIGREKAGEIKLASENAGYESKGMAITMSRVEHINKIYETDITVRVNDTMDSAGRPLGTTVILEFPLDME